MKENSVHQCECDKCQQAAAHPDQELHHWINIFFSRLDEQHKRWYAALEAKKVGHGGQKLVAQITGLSIRTIQRGRVELEQDLVDRPAERVRLPGGGRKLVEKKSRR